MKRLIIILILILTKNLFSQNDIHRIFLFDNSGSMSGYYREPTSNFKLFCKSLIKNSISGSEKLDILLFTKTDSKRGIISPRSIYSGTSKDFIMEKVMNDFVLMRGNDGEFGVTDIIEALDKAILTLNNRDGIIWLITDNINDISGTGDSSYLNTLEYYQRLRSDDNIRKILLYPIPEKITEAGYTSNGYVVYGIIYSRNVLSQKELEVYDRYLRSVGIKQKAITLKPQDVGTIILTPKITQSKITAGKLYFDGHTLRGYDFEEGERIKEVFNDIALKSNLYPYIIRSARLNVHLENFSSTDYSVKSLGTQSISPSTVSNVSPEGEVKGFSIIFNMPEITPNFSFNTIFKEDFAVGGNLILEVSQVEIELDEAYINSFKELFALQTVPEVFKPVLKDKKIITRIPLEIRMRYGPWRLTVLIGIISGAILMLILIFYLLFKKRGFIISVDNQEKQPVLISLLSSFKIYADNYELGDLKVTFSGSPYLQYGKQTQSGGKKIKLNEGIPVEIQIEEDEYRKKEYSVMLVSKISRREEKDKTETEKAQYY